jgi:uncharacterized protein YdbL (DUF1318 family)
MKRLVTFTVILSAFVQPVIADDKSDSNSFYGIDKRKAHTQVLGGSMELAASGLLAYIALNRAGIKKVPSTTGISAYAEAKSAVDTAKANKTLLEKFAKRRGAGLIRGTALAGSTVTFAMAGHRAYEWFATDAEPTWSPFLSYMLSEERVSLKDMPESRPSPAKIDTASSIKVPAESDGDLSLEQQLKAKLEERLSKINPGRKALVESQLSDVQARNEARRQEIADLQNQKRKAEVADASANTQNKVNHTFNSVIDSGTANFFKSRPEADGDEFARKILFGMDVTAGSIALSALLTSEGAKAVKQAEKALAQANALVEGTLPEGLEGRLAAIKESDDQIKTIQEQIKQAEAARMNDIAKSLRATEAQAKLTNRALRNGRVVDAQLKSELVALAQTNLSETRALAVRTGKAGKFFKGVVIGVNGLVLVDAIGRAIEWRNSDAHAQFSPGITWALMQTKKPAEQVLEGFQKYITQPGSKFFQEAFEASRKNARDSSYFERGPKF